MNHLSHEKSPYLLQHKDNPIHWRVWGPEAFAEAKRLNRPVFLSVGYSTCHWCHVMAHESFEDQEVADVLNSTFVCIKVDREERPDVDAVYMKALQALSGGGGWPMSVWLTPDGKPFFAGTYFPKYRLLQLLRRINEIWGKEPAQLNSDGEKLIAAVREDEPVQEESAPADWERALQVYISHFQHHFDEVNGGFGGKPKFPQTMNLQLMMRQDVKTGLNQAEAIVTKTLTQMSRGGIYDHLNGGFHRYSVDEKWLVPHFEKMLYDQALIAVTLIEASQAYGDMELARAARETLDYVKSEMTSPAGGFFSAEDADSFNPKTSRNEEGFFATYAFDELKEILSEAEQDLLRRAYGVSPQGAFEGRNILHLQEGYDGGIKSDLAGAFSKLRQLRQSKPKPHLDDKIIAAWNGWMIWAFAKGARAFGDASYLAAADKALGFARQHLMVKGELARYHRDGEAKGRAIAEDYASLIHACLELDQVAPGHREFALELQSKLDLKFWDDNEGAYFTNDGEDPLIPLRAKDDYDGVTPNANSMAALNLVRLHLLTGEALYRHRAERIINFLFPKFKQYPSGLPFLGLAIDALVSNTKVAVVSGHTWPKELNKELQRKFLPHVFWMSPETGWPVAVGKSGERIYVCEEGQCLRPAESKSEAISQLSK